MKLKVFITFAAVASLFISCSNDKKPTEMAKQVSTIKSDILIENTKHKSGIVLKDGEQSFIIVSGKSLLRGTATVKVLNEAGEETHCDTFPAKELLPAQYKTANSVLKEARLRETVLNYFADNSIEEALAEL